jgi:hypothetical protein
LDSVDCLKSPDATKFADTHKMAIADHRSRDGGVLRMPQRSFEPHANNKSDSRVSARVAAWMM